VDKPADPSASSTAQFTFTNPEPAATFECSLDTASFVPCASPASYASLADGSHTFNVRAVDTAGNPDPVPATYSWSAAEYAMLKVDSQADAYYLSIGDAFTVLGQLSNPTGIQLLLKGRDFAEPVVCIQPGLVFLGGGYSDGFTGFSYANPTVISGLTIGGGCAMIVDNVAIK